MTKILADIAGERGRIGKTFMSNRVRDHLESRERPWTTRVVRIETRNGRPAARKEDPRIFLSDVEEARDEIGGEFTAFEPLWQAIRDCPERGAVIIDWPAGVSDLRARVLAAANLTRVKQHFKLVGMVLSTGDATVLEQAAIVAERTRAAAPEMAVVAVINEIAGGGLDRAPPGSDRHRALEALRKAMASDPIITLPAVPRRAWELFDHLGLEMPFVLEADLEILSEVVGRDEFVVEACRVMLAGWWQQTEVELRRIFPDA